MALIQHGPHAPEQCAAPRSTHGPAACVAIPARNEEALIGACLGALAAQQTPARFEVLVLANNCTDDTADVVRRVAANTPLNVHLYDLKYDAGPAPAARARRYSVNAALGIVAPGGVVMMTDADSQVDARWVAANLEEVRLGADAVCGVIAPNLMEAALFPEAVLQRGVAEFVFEQAAGELEYRLDPEPRDAWPRHRMETGASLAVTAEMLVRVGGVPEVQPAEDRALVRAIRRADGLIRHSFGPSVSTSCRMDGRAVGGWADDLRERVNNPDAPCHDVLEPACALYRRALLRGAMRRAWSNVVIADWAVALRVNEADLSRAIDAPTFEEAWARLEAISPRLRAQRLHVHRLAEETRRVRKLLARVSTQEGALELA